MTPRIALAAVLLTFTSPLQAAVFNSKNAYEVLVPGPLGGTPQALGITPSTHPITIPENALWCVQPVGSPTNAAVDQLVKDLKTQLVPGVCLSNPDGRSKIEISNVSWKRLAELTPLRYLRLEGIDTNNRVYAQIAAFQNLEVLDVQFGESHVTSASLTSIGTLKHLRELRLPLTILSEERLQAQLGDEKLKDALSDASLKQISGLTELRRLEFRTFAPGTSGLKYLSGMTQLESLSLVDADVNDAGLVALSDMTHLRTLDLSGCGCHHDAVGARCIGDLGLHSLERLTQLESLRLRHTETTDAGLVSLKNMKQLQALDLSSTQITNEGLLALKDLPMLNRLYLIHTAVDDQALDTLVAMPHLRTVFLLDSKVTLAGHDILAQRRKDLYTDKDRVLAATDPHAMHHGM